MDETQCELFAQVIPVLLLVIAVEKGMFARLAANDLRKYLGAFVVVLALYAECWAINGAGEGGLDGWQGLTVAVCFLVLVMATGYDLISRIFSSDE